MIDLDVANYGASTKFDCDMKNGLLSPFVKNDRNLVVEKKKHPTPESSNGFQICWRDIRGYHCQYFVVQTHKQEGTAKCGSCTRIISTRK